MTVHAYRCVNRQCQWYLIEQYCEMTPAEYTRATGRPFRCVCQGPLVADSEPHVVGTDIPTPENDPTGRFRP